MASGHVPTGSALECTICRQSVHFSIIMGFVAARALRRPLVVYRRAGRLEAGDALDEQRFTPPNIEARPSASGARRRSYTRGSEVGDRCRPSL